MSEEKAQLLLSPFNSSRFRENELRVTDLPFASQDVVKKVFKRNEKELVVIRQDFWRANWHHMMLLCFSLLISGWCVYLSFTTKFTPMKDPETVLCRRSFIILSNKRLIMYNGAQDVSKIFYSDIIEVTYRINCCGRDIYVRYDDEPRTLRLFTVKSPQWVINQINFLRRQHWEDKLGGSANSVPNSNLNSFNSLLVPDEYEDYV